jgi:hypothetical protein
LKFEHGTTVRDVLTGFQGITTAYATYITGNEQFLVQPVLDMAGAWRANRWLDVARLEQLPANQVKLPFATNIVGFDTPPVVVLP